MNRPIVATKLVKPAINDEDGHDFQFRVSLSIEEILKEGKYDIIDIKYSCGVYFGFNLVPVTNPPSIYPTALILMANKVIV